MSMPTSRTVEHGPKATPRWLWLWLVIAVILSLNGIYYAHQTERRSLQSSRSSPTQTQEVGVETLTLAPGENTPIQYVRGNRRVCFDSWSIVRPYFWYDDDSTGSLKKYEDSEVTFVRFQIRNDSGDSLPIRFWYRPYNETC